MYYIFSGIIKALGRVKDDLNVSRYYIYRFISVWKILLFLMCIVFSIWMDGDEPGMFFQLFSAGFGPHNIVVEEVGHDLYYNRFTVFSFDKLDSLFIDLSFFQVQVTVGSTVIPDLANVTLTGDSVLVAAAYKSALYVTLIQVFAAYFCYIFGKFACKILIQGFSYAFPVNLVIPLVVNLLIAACGIRNGDNCFFHGTVPDYLFFESPPGENIRSNGPHYFSYK